MNENHPRVRCREESASEQEAKRHHGLKYDCPEEGHNPRVRRRGANVSQEEVKRHRKLADDPADEEELIPIFIRGEEITEEELERRARDLIVPPPYTRTQDRLTPENEVLTSRLRYQNISWTHRYAYNHMVSTVLRDQWRDISFTAAGFQHDFVNLVFTLPEIRGKPLYPSYSRDHRDASYSAREHPVVRITDSTGRQRVIRLNIGLFPVMLETVLCNLHPSNIDRGGTQLELEALERNSPRDEPLSEQRRRELRAFYRKHNESTTDQVPTFVINSGEQVGVSFDKQRNSVKQPVSVPGGRPHLRFISTGNKTSNLIIFFHERSRAADRKRDGGMAPTMQVHISDFMRNNMDDNHVNIFMPFHVHGWDYTRVMDELRNFVPQEGYIWDRVRLEMSVSHIEFELIMKRCGGRNQASYYEYLLMEMRGGGRNPMTDRAYTPAQVDRLLLEHMFRHMNSDYPKSGWNTPEHREVNDRKLRFLLMMVAELLMYRTGVLEPVDRDCWTRKKLVTIVRQIQNLHMRHLLEIRRQWIRWLKEGSMPDLMEINADAYSEAVLARFDITKTFERSLTGKSWGVFLPNGQCKPVALQCHEKLRRDSLYSAISQGNKSRKPVNPQVKNSQSRDDTASAHNRMCGLETPDGLHVGLTEHKTVTALITVQVDDAPLLILIRARDELSSLPTDDRNVALVVNGRFLGWCREKLEFSLRRMKRLGIIDILTCIVLVLEPRPTIYIYTDEGRVVQAYMVVEESSGEIMAHKYMPRERDFMVLLRAGYIEYLDALETRNKICSFDCHDMIERARESLQSCRMATRRVREAEADLDTRSWRSVAHLAHCRRVATEVRRFARVEYVNMDPSTQLGVMASIAPMIQKNYGVRTGFVTALLKQTIGAYVSNIRVRTDAVGREIMYGSAPGYHTVVGDAIGRWAYHMTQGTLLVWADPYTQEDSLVVNQKTVDAGFGAFWVNKRKDCDEEEHIRFGIAPSKRGFRKKYRNIMESGLPRRGRVIREDEVLVARTAYGIHADDYHMPHGECGTVLWVQIIKDGSSDLRRAMIILSKFHTTSIGYKESNTQGQKGTVGEIRPTEEMVQVYGKPEMLIQQIANPIPLWGRVTMASPDEMKYSPAFGLNSTTMNATPFARYNPEHLERLFIEHGYRPNGMERILLPDGNIARQRAFVGRMAYMTLSHIPDDKIHVRSEGPREVTTDQPVQGRNVNGGLRFGVMELAQLMNLGASGQIVERLMLHSDKRVYIYCQECNLRYDTLFFRGSRCRGCLKQDFVRVPHPAVLRFMENVLCIMNVDFQLTFYAPNQSSEIKPTTQLPDTSRISRSRA